jgi:hypothetical protein
MPTFSLLYTSVRAHCIIPVLEDWLRKASAPGDLEIILAIDGPDEKCRAVCQTKHAWPCPVKVFIQEHAPFNCVKGWNLAAAQAAGQVFVQLTDDMVPPEAWDTKLKGLSPPTWMEEDWAVHVEDGYVHDIMVLAIITKKRYDRFGYFFYRDYESIFSDTELTAVAYRENRVINAKHLYFEHRHPDAHKRPRDGVDLVHASKERWFRGEALFKHRSALGFPIDAGSSPPAPQPERFCAYIQATQDDLCLFEVGKRMIEEGVQDFFFSLPDEYWSGRPVPKEDAAELMKIINQITGLGANAEIFFHQVKKYRWPGDTRIGIETRVRNDALQAIKARGFEHVLIVDGDELWKRGTLKYVQSIVRQHRPTSLNCMMVPVVGFPGYPIDGATDVAVIYLNASATSFKECRTPFGIQSGLKMPLVIHFTGTRRTMEATVRKHRESGHYDDPDYDVEDFIRNKLPYIKPGFKNVHFYKKNQIWPGVRHWLADEITQIPESIWPYLALPAIVQSPA